MQNILKSIYYRRNGEPYERKNRLTLEMLPISKQRAKARATKPAQQPRYGSARIAAPSGRRLLIGNAFCLLLFGIVNA